MPGNMVPRQMFDHTLVPIKSPDRLHLLDYHAAPAAGITFEAGACLSLNSAGNFTTGAAQGATAVRPMPMFALQGTSNYSANSDAGNISGGVNSALPATGLFELETTEFVNQTYKPNDLLKPGTGDHLAKVMKLNAAPYGIYPVCGCVSKGLRYNRDNKRVLCFWTMFLPAGLNSSSSSSSSSSMSSSSLSSSSLSSSSSSLSLSSSSLSSSSLSLSSSSLSSSSLSLSSNSSSSNSSSSQSSSSAQGD